MRILFLSLLLAISTPNFAQIQGNGGIPKGHKLTSDFKQIDTKFFSQPDIEVLRAEDEVNDISDDAPWRFGFNNYTSLNLANAGTWTTLPNGDKIWQLVTICDQALTVNLTFSETEIPAGNELYVYNPAKDFILGKFTAEHLYKGKLGAELIPGNTAIVEYYVKKENAIGNVNICTVTHGYRTAKEFAVKAFGSSGGCNRNVNCSEGSVWVPQRNSAVMLVSGSSGFCSGALVNNTTNDAKPYVLTANHCYSDPTSWIFRFNWQAADCNNPASSPSFQSMSGAVLRSRATPSDFCLVEITGGLENNSVPLAYTPYFAGWDRSGNTPSGGIGIHHPSGDIKKISFENNPLISTTFGTCPPDSHWGITNWDSGVTEGGSSGSPLFDPSHRIVGQLHGGASACGGSNLSDEYGKFSYSWEPAASDSSKQLKYWLDPTNNGAVFIDGFDPNNPIPVLVDAGISSPQGVSGTFCGDSVTPTVVISNAGADTLVSLEIVYGYDETNLQTYTWTGVLPQWQNTSVTLPMANLSAGSHTFSATVNNPNASVDENSVNDAVSSTFNVVVGGQNVLMNLTLDCYGSETSWELQDATGTAIYAGSGYADNTEGLLTESWCLNYGCYKYVIMDSYGDGFEGGTGCSTDGSLAIVYNNETLAGIPNTTPNFGTQKELNFCVSGVGITTLNENAFSIYPNPAKTKVNIGLGNFQQANVELCDVSGKVLMQTSLTSTYSSLSVASFSAGTYFVKITVEGQTITKKLILE